MCRSEIGNKEGWLAFERPVQLNNKELNKRGRSGWGNSPLGTPSSPPNLSHQSKGLGCIFLTDRLPV